jgi:hypothetical protein
MSNIQTLTSMNSILEPSVVATPTPDVISPDNAPAAAVIYRRADYPSPNVAGMIAISFCLSVVGAPTFVCVIYAITRYWKRRNKQTAMEEKASRMEDVEQVEYPEEMKQLKPESLLPSYDEVAAVHPKADVCR